MIAAPDSDLTAFIDEVHSLLAAPSARRRRGRARVEHTLTSGYAYALGLEAERLRLERELLAAAETGESAEVVEVGRRMRAADGQLARLRGLLATLRTHAYDHPPV